MIDVDVGRSKECGVAEGQANVRDRIVSRCDRSKRN